MSVKQLIRTLWAHKWLLLLIIAGAVGLAVAANNWLPPKYVAEAALVIDLSGGDPLKDGALAPQVQTSYVATQVDVIGSHTVALKVVDREKLVDSPETQRAFQEDTGGQGAIRDWAADNLLTHLKVRPPGNSNVVYLEYASRNPQTAARLANAFAESYIQTSIELNVDPAQRQANWFEEQVKGLRTSLEEAQSQLSAFQSQQNVVGTDDKKLDVENARLEELSTQLVAAQTTMYQATAREQEMARATAANLFDESLDGIKNPLLQNLKTDLARAEAKLADVSQRFASNHPAYQSAEAEYKSLQNKVKSEVDNAKRNVAREAAVARQQVAAQQQAVEQQRQRILSLGHTQDQYTVLKRNVDNAQAAYDAALQRTSQNQLESRLDHTNIAILSRAAVPITPASPRPALNIVLAVILGLLLGIAIIMLLDSMGREPLPHALGLPQPGRDGRHEPVVIDPDAGGAAPAFITSSGPIVSDVPREPSPKPSHPTNPSTNPTIHTPKLKPVDATASR